MSELQIVSRRLEMVETEQIAEFVRFELGRAAVASGVVHEYVYGEGDRRAELEADDLGALLEQAMVEVAARRSYHRGVPVVRYPLAERPTALVVASYLPQETHINGQQLIHGTKRLSILSIKDSKYLASHSNSGGPSKL